MDDSYILNILIVGFHHKRGVQLEYCYPPLFPGQGHDASELPEEWQNLPYLALPDGAHNYEQDHVYFVLPSLTDREQSVFCVACYRQIDSDKLLSKSDDVTRSSVQKSVVVVSRVPLFGAIRQRLSHVAQSYFELLDFSRVEIIEETFMDFKRAVTKNSVSTQVFSGLSVKELLLRYRQKLLVLFKLVLLERRILVHMNPASRLGNTLLTLTSLYPGLLESGLSRCGAVFKSRYNFRNLSDSDFVSIERDTENFPSPAPSPTSPTPPPLTPTSSELATPEPQLQQPQASHGRLQDTLSGAASGLISSVRAGLARVSTGAPASSDNPLDQQPPRPPSPRSPFEIDDCGFPLALFAESAIFLPYVSLQQIGLLEDANVRACLLGANNVLYRQQHSRRRIDVMIGADSTDFSVYDRGLARLLRLSGPDEAFIQRLLDKTAPSTPPTGPASTDDESRPDAKDLFAGSEWEGSDDWLRAQFRSYLVALLLTADPANCADSAPSGPADESASSSDEGDFNASYVRALRATFHYRAWLAGPRPGLSGASRRHPCRGQSALGVRINQFLTGTEQGKKVSSAVQSTGRALEDTGKVVGGAIYSAGSAMSGFFSGLSSKAASRLSGSQSHQQLQSPQQQQPARQDVQHESPMNS